MADEDFEHWPDDRKHCTRPAEAAQGYDSNNARHRHAYYAAISAPDPPVAPAQHQQIECYPQVTYYAHAPAQVQQPRYDSYPQQACYSTYPSGAAYYACAQPASAPAPAREKSTTYVYEAQSDKGMCDNVWVGRTKAQVDEDNQKIAAREGVYDKRKVQPAGVKEDQMFWVIDGDDITTLRTFRDIKQMKGEWKLDPRFEKVYYFLREEEEEEYEA